MRSLRFSAMLLVVCFLLPDTGSAAKPDKGPFKYLSPVPGAEWVSPETDLIVRPGARLAKGQWMKSFTVRGSVSGLRAGRWTAASDMKTFIFDPGGTFVPGEQVEVVLGRGKNGRFSYSFTVAPRTVQFSQPYPCSCLEGAFPEPAPPDRPAMPAPAPRMTGAGYELPESFPDLSILVNDGPAPGSLFISSMVFGPGAGDRYLMILGNDGEFDFFRPMPSPTLWDFKMQPDGRLSFFLFARHKYYFMDDTYTIVDSVWARNYGGTDAHDVQVLPNGNFLVIGTQEIPYDMSGVVEGGNPDANIVNMVIQELDGDDNVVFEWRSFDHFDPLDAIGYNLTGERVDYVHTNSVELDDDGGIIMSHRHLDEVTKVSRDTGEIVWHMGGKNNDFTLVGDTQWFTHQHSARRQPGGTLTVFDNGNNSDPQESRAVEYVVDEENLTATMVWEFRHDPPTYGRAMGNVHRQPGGNTVIGWGTASPNVTEVRPDGSTAFELSLEPGTLSYRAFRFLWSGVAARPDLWATTYDNTLALNYVKFGDEDVVAYNIYRSDESQPVESVQTVTGNRFVVHDYQAGQALRFRVTALDGGGVESPFSNEITVTPEFGSRLVDATVMVTPRTLNVSSHGNWIQARVDFASASECSASDIAAAARLNDAVDADRVTPRSKRGQVVGLDIKFPRDQVADLLAPGAEVEITVSGRVGECEFVATDAIRVIGSGGTNGLSDGDHDSDVKVDDKADRQTALSSIMPNPFNPTTIIRYYVAVAGQHVTIEVFDVTGRSVQTLVDGPVAAGDATVAWDGRDGAGTPLASGVYFCRMRTGDTTQTLKMLLMK